jgi:hypothetical protein
MHGPVASLCFLAALAAAAPARAQFVGRHDYGPVDVPAPFIGDSRQRGPGVGRELRDVRHLIQAEREAGILSKSEARHLKREANAIEALAERDDRQGLSSSAQDELEARTHYLADAVARPR